jgi:hypothetical protein
MSPTDPPSRDASARQAPPPPKASAWQAPPSRDASVDRHGHGGGDGPHDDPEVDHEYTEVNLRAIVGFAVGLAVVTGIVFVLMYGLFWYFSSQAAKNDPAVSPLVRPPAEMPASTTGSPFFGQAEGPRLLTHEPTVLSKQRSMEADVLGSYGWVDEKSAVARMPIAEAKKLILQRGLPARTEGDLDPTLGTRRAAFGEPSGGRTIPVGRKKEEVTKEEATPAPAATHKGHGQ